MVDRLHLTIGEVLSLLNTEFPDVSISKIRFLESQGLVNPERTPSGYRKFYEQDVDQLRWVLKQQREHFLPLKVIKDRLEESGGVAPESGAPGDETAQASLGGPDRPVQAVPGPTVQAPGDREQISAVRVTPIAPQLMTGPTPPNYLDSTSPGLVIDDSPTAETPVGAEPATPDAYSSQELADAAGCSLQLIKDLLQFGLLTPTGGSGGSAYFEPDALRVAKLGARFDALGVEPRHLRAWRNAADRETSLFEQLVTPLLRQKNPEARKQAAGRLNELGSLGGELRAALIAESFKTLR